MKQACGFCGMTGVPLDITTARVVMNLAPKHELPAHAKDEYGHRVGGVIILALCSRCFRNVAEATDSYACRHIADGLDARANA